MSVLGSPHSLVGIGGNLVIVPMGLTREDTLERLVCIRSAREDSGPVWKRDDRGRGEYAGESEGGAVSSYARVVLLSRV